MRVARRLVPAPLLTCEPVLTEAAFLLKREGRETDVLFELMERGVLRVGLEIEDQLADLRTLMSRYRDRPMSLADACLVRLSELHRNSTVFTECSARASGESSCSSEMTACFAG